MIVDFEDQDGAEEFRADLCIVGAGPAGITLARRLAGTGLSILLLESGGFDIEMATQELYDGDIAGLPYPDLEVARMRFFGGTSGHWGGHCAALMPIDFERRDWVAHSGWPFGYEELARYYGQASEICGASSHGYTAEEWRREGLKLFDFDPERVVNRIWQFSIPQRRFGEAFRAELAAAERVSVLLHANVTRIDTDDTGQTVTQVLFRTIAGKEGRALARHYVLACGGIENARLLLDNDHRQAGGLGNGRDLVGRFFMEHPHVLSAFAVPLVPLAEFAPYYTENKLPGGYAGGKPGVSEALQRREGLLNTCLSVGYGYSRSPGYTNLRAFGNELLRGRLPEDIGGKVVAVLGDLAGAGEGLYRRLADEQFVWMSCQPEQAPNPDSRVTLSAERNALGLRQPVLDWRMNRQDKHTVRRTVTVVGEELARLGLARTRIDDWLLADDDGWGENLEVRFHHIGTTRMHNDPAHGVVDRDGLVHGMANLHIAGSSVFPTSGFANPTLTIVAMSLRLAEHLAGKMGAAARLNERPGASLLRPATAGR